MYRYSRCEWADVFAETPSVSGCMCIQCVWLCVCVFISSLSSERNIVGGCFKIKMFLFGFFCSFVKCKKVHLTKTSCINLSINLCLWSSHVFSFFFSIHGMLPLFRQSTCVNVCVSVSCEHDSFLHMLCWPPWCRWAVCVRDPLDRSPGALSICLLRSRCWISLKEQDYSQTSCLSYRFQHQGKITLMFIFGFSKFFVPSYKAADNALKQTQMYDLTELYDMYECLWYIDMYHKGHSFSLWWSQAWCSHALHNYTHKHTRQHIVIAPWTSLSSPATFLLGKAKCLFVEQLLNSGRFVHLLFKNWRIWTLTLNVGQKKPFENQLWSSNLYLSVILKE